MDNQALTRLEALRKRNADRGWVNHDLYRLLYKPDLYEVAYEKIKSTPGNMTAGTDGETLDGFSFDTINGIIQNLRDETFQFKPVRREFIPKANGKMRPLGIPSPKDKIVQEVIHMILEAIYDSPHGQFFLDCSHGFRPNRSTHTALREFGAKWSGVTWIIEGDIKGCFDNVDHHVLTDLLRRKIADDRFINLIWKALRSGYLWKKVQRNTLFGTPQGSVCSPILANIYLHELDVFIEGLRQKYEKGKDRRMSLEYKRLINRKNSLFKKSGGVVTDEMKDVIKQLRQTPSVELNDPDYVRIKYIRYADDWIVGVTGPRSLADTVKNEIQVFLKDVLKLELSEEKTVITHPKTEEAFFLGTRLMIGKPGSEPKISTTKSRSGKPYRRRGTGWTPVMKAPVAKLVAKLHREGFCHKNGFPTSKKVWTLLDADQIINLYSSVNRGVLNYYRFVHNFASMGRIQYILRFSLAKTLAHKYRISMKAVFKKYGRNICLKWKTSDDKDRQIEFAEVTDWSIRTNAFMVNPADLDQIGWQTHLRTRSKLCFPCLICGGEDKVQMHHVRHIRKMGNKKPTGFTAVMRALNRKQVPVCEDCHRRVHRGEYDGLSLKDLAYDFAARKPV